MTCCKQCFNIVDVEKAYVNVKGEFYHTICYDTKIKIEYLEQSIKILRDAVKHHSEKLESVVCNHPKIRFLEEHGDYSVYECIDCKKDVVRKYGT